MDPEELRYTGTAAPDQPTMPRSEFTPLVDSLVDGLLVITSEGIIVRANAALCEMLGMAGVANRAEGYNENLMEQIKPLLSAFGTLIAAHQNNQSRIKAEEALFRTG